MRAVVGQLLDDAEARAAVGAVGERVAEAAIARGKDIDQALLTGRDVGQDERGLGAFVLALADDEAGVANASRNENSMLWMIARGGFSRSRRRRKLRSSAPTPSTSMKTPCAEFITQPVRFSSLARR